MHTKARRVPTQARSRKRYEAILDAAADLFAEAGFEATTVEAIARRAETSIGSVYQFFPDKKAIFIALTDRNIGRSTEALAGLLQPSGRSWSELLESTIDGIVALLRSDVGFRAVWTNLQLYGEYADAEAAAQRDFIRTVRALVAANGPHLSGEDHKAIAAMIVHATSLLLAVALQEPSGRSERMVREIKRMLVAYLATYLDRDT